PACREAVHERAEEDERRARQERHECPDEAEQHQRAHHEPDREIHHPEIACLPWPGWSFAALPARSIASTRAGSWRKSRTAASCGSAGIPSIPSPAVRCATRSTTTCPTASTIPIVRRIPSARPT